MLVYFYDPLKTGTPHDYHEITGDVWYSLQSWCNDFVFEDFPMLTVTCLGPIRSLLFLWNTP